MSSLLDAAIQSDNANQQLRSDDDGAAQRRRQARGPPSVSTPGMNTPGMHSDMFPIGDDEVVGVRGSRKGPRPAGPRPDVDMVQDTTAMALANEFEHFLEHFAEEPDDIIPGPASSAPTTDKYYIEQIYGLARYGLSTLYVDYQHMMQHGDGILAGAIQEDYYRYHPHMIRALNNLIAKYVPRYFKQHRQPQSSAAASLPDTQDDDDSAAVQTPNQQTDKLFTLAFYNLPLISRLRQLRTESVGKLLSVSGTVTRTSEIRPELSLATFVCEVCNAVVPNVEQVFKYSEPTQCPNLTCGNRQAWRLDVRQSTFVDWQKVRVQENSSEIPTGSMPRTMDVILHGEMVDRAKAGEKCIFTGTLIVVPDVSQFRVPGVRPQATRDTGNAPRGGDVGGSGVSGLRALGVRDLTYRMAFLANMVTPDTSTTGQSATQHLRGKAGGAEGLMSSLHQSVPQDKELTAAEEQAAYLASLNRSEIDELKAMVHTPNIFIRLVDSLAPMIYGHTVVKKGLLLQLLGGVSKKTPEGMALRGDINICIVGDPSTSKSQFLKYICSFIPRAVYTSGKASSAAGLTAAVIKDEETGEFTIEAGALMLADNGICAIDEFDKMDITDQVAIHEAMEQQTISIAKAGIQATLNARTSILAAANPVGGRYNRKTTLRANINMSAPIMSRFDLFFVVLDECNETVDQHLAEHIVNVHRLRDDAVQPEFSTEQLQRYIRFAKTFQPVFRDDAKVTLVEKYKELRADDAQGGIGRNSYRITVRQLESMIRLSEAIAKSQCVEEVEPSFVIEAFKLLRQSIISVEKDDVEMEEDDDEPLTHTAAEVMAGADQEDDDADAETDAVMAQDGTSAAPGRQRIKLTWDRYIAIQNMMLRRVNNEQDTAEDGVEENDLLTWYLEQKEDDLDSQEDLENEHEIAKRVLKKMVKENMLLRIRGEGLADDDGQGLQEADTIKYALHPNCPVEDL